MGRIQLFPNPTNGTFTVELPSAMSKGGRILVHDALGQLVVEQNLAAGVERSVFDLGGRSEGLYFVSVLMGGQRSVERLVLTR
jgi:hypothetical protein